MTCPEIIMLHSVSSTKSSIFNYCDVSTETNLFEKILSDRKNCLRPTINDLINSLDNGLGQKVVTMLTFDDGYRNFITEVLPILEKHDFPASVFITTNFADGDIPFELKLASYIEAHDRIKIDGKEIDLSSQNKKEVYNSVRGGLKRSSFEKIEKFLYDFSIENEGFESSFPSGLFLNWEEISKLSKHPLVTIGSHCVTHCLLKNKDYSTIKLELVDSKFRIEECINKPVCSISYPYGGSNSVVRELAKNSGYEIGFKAKSSFSGTLFENRYAIARLPINKME